MSDSVGRFGELFGLAPRSASTKNWENVAAAMGTPLPADYMALIDRYGGGRIEDYLYILEPGCENANYDLLDHSGERAEALQELWEGGEPVPPQLDDAPGARLIPWATTDNGEFLYWLVRPGVPPEEWTVMVNEARGEEWEHYPMGCVDFLLGALTGQLRSELLWTRFPLAEHQFEAL